MAAIYKITNVLTGKFYIGKTESSIETRFRGHVASSKKPKTALHKAMQKYGINNFAIDVLVECEPLDLDNLERKYILEMSPHYNMTSGGEGGSTTHGKKWITDGSVDIYIDANDALPQGWAYGRSKCVFNDSNKQSEFSKRSNRASAGEKVSNGFKTGRLKTSEAEIERRRARAKAKPPSSSPEARAKISAAQKERLAAMKEQGINPMKAAHEKSACSVCGALASAGNLKRWHNENCRHNDKNLHRQTE